MDYFRAFDFIKNKKLRKILILDYKEVLTSLNRQCPKAAVVLIGGIIEAILKDLGRKKNNRVNVETEYKKIHKYKKGVDDMDLFFLIKALERLHLISNVDASTANILRDYRNMIHPFRCLERPNKKSANLAKQLLDNLLKDRNSKYQNKKDEKKGELFLTSDYYKNKRNKKEFKKTIDILYKSKGKVALFDDIKSLEVFKRKKNPGKSVAPILGYLRSLGICDYDKNSWQNKPRRYNKWIFNKKFNYLVKKYLE